MFEMPGEYNGKCMTWAWVKSYEQCKNDKPSNTKWEALSQSDPIGPAQWNYTKLTSTIQRWLDNWFCTTSNVKKHSRWRTDKSCTTPGDSPAALVRRKHKQCGQMDQSHVVRKLQSGNIDLKRSRPLSIDSALQHQLMLEITGKHHKATIKPPETVGQKPSSRADRKAHVVQLCVSEPRKLKDNSKKNVVK